MYQIPITLFPPLRCLWLHTPDLNQDRQVDPTWKERESKACKTLFHRSLLLKIIFQPGSSAGQCQELCYSTGKEGWEGWRLAAQGSEQSCWCTSACAAFLAPMCSNLCQITTKKPQNPGVFRGSGPGTQQHGLILSASTGIPNIQIQGELVWN